MSGNEAERDRDLLLSLLVDLEVEGDQGTRVKLPIGQPSRSRYRREDYGWDPAFFVQCLLGVGETERAIEMMDAIAWKVQLAGRVPLVTRWCPRDHTLLWRARARRDDPRFSEATQPALVAQAAVHVAKCVGVDRIGTERLMAYARAAEANLNWLFAHRVAPGRRLISVIDPIETGMDSLVAWDQLLETIVPGSRGAAREFAVHHASAFLTLRYLRMKWDLRRILADPRSCLIEPVSFNVFVIRELRALSALWSALGDHNRSRDFSTQAVSLQAELERTMWSDGDGAYLPQARVRGEWRPLTTLSIDSLYPLLLADLPAERAEALYRLLATKFTAHRMVPVSAERTVRSGLRARLWGPGQVWANTNMFVRDGLRYHSLCAPRGSEMAALADRIDADWRSLKAYHEYYNQDGRGGGEGPFFWDCLRRTTFSIDSNLPSLAGDR